MSKILKLRRGTTAEIANAGTNQSELMHDVDTDELVLGTGTGKKVVGGADFINAPKVIGKVYNAVTVGNNIQIATQGKFEYEQGNWIQFKQDVDALQPMTISIDNGSNLVAKDTNGDNINFIANTVYLCYFEAGVPNFFTLAPRGVASASGGVSWFTEYDGANAFIKDVQGNNINVKIGDYIYNEPDSIILDDGNSVIVDRTTPTQVVNQAYSTAGNGGRKLVRLNNGWLVAIALRPDNNYIDLFKSKDNGLTWNKDGWLLAQTAKYAIQTDGVNILLLTTRGAQFVSFKKIDGTIDRGDVSLGSVTDIDTNQNEFNGASLTIASNGDLHATWSSKNASYPNSFNIRYTKSTDGGATWTAVTQATSDTIIGNGYHNPCIVCNVDNNPCIFTIRIVGGAYTLYALTDPSPAFFFRTIKNANTHAQSNPCAIVTNDGNVHVVWNGKDATDSSINNIRYSKSTDNGVTWSAEEKITSGNVYDQSVPTIGYNDNNNLSIIHSGVTVDSSSFYVVQLTEGVSGSWGASSRIDPTGGTTQGDPSICENFQSYTEPLAIYKKTQAGEIVFYGEWTVGNAQIIPATNNALNGDQIRATINGILKFNNASIGDKVVGIISTENLID